MATIQLPAHAETGQTTKLTSSRRYTIIGGNGAGKSRFMEEVILHTKGHKSILLPISTQPPYEAYPGLENLLERISEPEKAEELNAIGRIWSTILAGSSLNSSVNGINFANGYGSESFSFHRLSRGEKSVLWFLLSMALVPSYAVVFVDSPTLFMHPSVAAGLWDEIERWRNDCTFVYDTTDPVFTSTRPGNIPIWIRSYNREPERWNYIIVDKEEQNDELLLDLLGSRRPVLFIEGDAAHSIDARLYSAIFREYTVKPVGSCNKVIEATRTFSSLNGMHRLESHGLVDRDRRTPSEVSYLRMKDIMVPEVAEVENIFLTEGVIRIMAKARGKNPDTILNKVRGEIIANFRVKLENQALQHTRHRMKRDVERKIDARFSCITALELHIKSLINKLRPRDHYNMLVADFHRMLHENDYSGILRVFNEKSIFRQSCVIPLLGYTSPENYIEGVLKLLHSEESLADDLRKVIRHLFDEPENHADQHPQQRNKHINTKDLKLISEPTGTKVVNHKGGDSSEGIAEIRHRDADNRHRNKEGKRTGTVTRHTGKTKKHRYG